ncbi:tyrosine-type recombinase/integrase [Mediterraneibacter glycyrrhizinilyticus]|uniref:tyrosine-type recombinase/integrase n=1 Tax=Mediterraneibacter glycyrrhizinilyticus TaxID=342942 RepID=UPI0025AA7B01|nr:tyrosine-type recombinase/integrase [Mediterraneibacter glycyrrhizinilyticus]MCF2570113.1 tyrosine-type recombinase/integrase [Mediterraneibacter glycyrrhizinilyticus]MDN0062076.1 tyrosine-type recombinase/integrase [Mediterraneibacter glycyrrhizinilyticus]
MALTTCPECSGKVSDKAYSCPHCGYPLRDETSPPRRAKSPGKRRRNGTGTIVKLSGKRRKPFQVRVNTRIDEWGYPRYDVLGNFPDRVSADIALAEYNKDPFDIANRKKTFGEVFKDWYKWKYKTAVDAPGKKSSSQYCALAAFKHCDQLHNRIMPDISALELQQILDREDLSHSMLEHIKTLFNQMYRYALQFDIVAKNCAEFVRIGKEDDTESGIPFTAEERRKLWDHKDEPFVDTILIYIYSGWRINELAGMPLENIDLEARTFTGGLKNRYSRNRTVPIHSKIYDMVKARYNPHFRSLIYHDGTQDITEEKYREYFTQALTACRITEKHTPHDCRHTCNSLLLKAKVDRVARYKIMGHAGKDINERIYSHMTTEQLREELEKI